MRGKSLVTNICKNHKPHKPLAEIPVKNEKSRTLIKWFPHVIGVVLSENSSTVERCGNRYLRHHSSAVFDIVANKIIPFKETKERFNRMVETSMVQKVFYEENSFKFLLYVELGILVCNIPYR